MVSHETRMCLERGHQHKLTHSIQTVSSACQAFDLTKLYHVFDSVIFPKYAVRIEHFQQTIVQEHGSKGSCPHFQPSFSLPMGICLEIFGEIV
jgi:hypothetical protein